MSNETLLTELSLKMDLFSEQMHALQKDVREVRDRQIRLEAQNTDSTVKLLEARLAMLEADLQRRSGAIRFGESLPRIAGWIVAAIAGVYAWYKGS